MDVTQFSALLDAARAAHPTWFDLPPDRLAADADLDALESALGANLPSSYRWFLKTLGGGDFAFASIYSADPSSDMLLTRNQPDMSAPFIAFSDDGTGNLIGFPVVAGQCEDRVLVLDHETGELREAHFDGFLDFVATVGLRRGHG